MRRLRTAPRGCAANSLLTIRLVLRVMTMVAVIVIASSEVTAHQHSRGLDPARALTEFAYQTWQKNEGLPQATVQAIAQTPDGYLWIGTQEGLVRFDGTRFYVHNRQNTPALRRNVIFALCTAPDGDLWIAAYGSGIIRRRGNTFESVLTREQLLDPRVTSMCFDSTGRLWIGGYGGVQVFTEQTVRTYTEVESLSSKSVLCLCADREGQVWAGTANGLNCVHDDHITTYYAQAGLPSNQISALCSSRDGKIWIGTDQGVSVREGNRFAKLRDPNGLLAHKSSALLEDARGTLWIGSIGGGLTRYVAETLTNVRQGNGLSDDNVIALSADREGNVWVGTRAGGLTQVSGGPFTSFQFGQTPSDNLMWCVCQDRGGALWFGSGNAVIRMKGRQWQRFSLGDTLGDGQVRSLAVDADGSLLAAHSSGKIFRLQREGPKLFARAHQPIRSLFVDSRGRLWVCGVAGVLRLERGAAVHDVPTDSLAGVRVESMIETHDGTLVISSNQGLFSWGKAGFKRVPVKQGKLEEMVSSMREDTQGALWLATTGEGLMRLKRDTLVCISSVQGLFDDTIYDCIEDDSGWFWMTSNLGVFRASVKELNDVADGIASRVHCDSYGVVDGMKSAECNAGFPGVWKADDGALWFPTMNGVARVHPRTLERNPVPPGVSIESVILNQQGYEGRRSVSVPPGDGKLEFAYAGISFIAGGSVTFRYMLEGFENAWNEVGTRRVALYTNIPPGKYRFRVIACNRDGVWNEVGDSVEFTLQPFFYQTNLFKAASALVALLLLGSMLMVYVRRHRRTLATAQLRAELSHAQLQALRSQLHPHFLFNTMNTISLLTDENPKKAGRMVLLLSELLRQMLEFSEADEVPLRRELELLNAYLEIQRMRFGKRLSIRYDIEEKVLDARLPHLTLQPLVENAIQHGISRRRAGGHIDIRAQRVNDELIVQVEDDGPGLPAEKGTGNNGIGLANTRARLACLYGKASSMRLERGKEKGAVATVAIPYHEQLRQS